MGFVPPVGLEPTRHKTYVPKTYVSTIPPRGCFEEGVRFELTELLHPPVFKTGAIDQLCQPSNFPTLRFQVSRFIGFLFLKNLLVLPVKNIQHYWEGLCQSLYPTMSHSRRRHSAESFLKS